MVKYQHVFEEIVNYKFSTNEKILLESFERKMQYNFENEISRNQGRLFEIMGKN